MQKRGVIYVYWGEKVEKELARSIDSLKHHHPDLPYKCFQLPNDSTLLDKAKMLKMSPFETTLFLDTDTVVMDRLDFGFEQAEKHGLACCINECPWARRYADIDGDQVEYNTSVMFFSKIKNTVDTVFESWGNCAEIMDSSIVSYRKGKRVVTSNIEQAAFSQAIVDTKFNPFVLPLNWSYRQERNRAIFGPIKIWRDRSEVPLQLRFWNEDQTHEASIIKCFGDADK